jgi:SAM-dependent methyltransferase
MGNLRWIRRTLREAQEAHRPEERSSLVEVGSGDGRLASRLAQEGWNVTAIDLMPKPPTCAQAVDWQSGDVREFLGDCQGAVVVANLFWHHFRDAELKEIGTLLGRSQGLVAAEPWRTRPTQWLGRTMYPWVNEVTRHDMMVSIRAGFLPGELPALWGLSREEWEVHETVDWRGAYHLQAWRRNRED